MKTFSLSLILFFLLSISTQINAQTKPAYCDQLPTTYEKGAGPSRPSLPMFGTEPVTKYKVQVAVLRDEDAFNYPFHSKLVARYRPCEQVWVIESKETFKTRAEANKLKAEMLNVGYKGCYVTEIVGYE